MTKPVGWAIAVLLAIAAGLFARHAYLHHADVVNFVIPDDYRGFFCVVVDREHGESIRASHRSVTLRIPSNGILRVHDDWYEHSWHTDAASTESGDALETDTDSHGGGRVGIWGIGAAASSNLGHYDSYFVGTEDEWMRLRKENVNEKVERWLMDQLRTEPRERKLSWWGVPLD